LKRVDFVLDKPGHKDLGEIVLENGKIVSGQVTNAQGEPIAGAQVEARSHLDIFNFHTSTATDAAGRYTIHGVNWAKGGTAYVVVFADDYGMDLKKESVANTIQY
jgi:hypothetical protein